MLSGTSRGPAHWWSPYQSPIDIFVLLGQGVSSLGTLGCGSLQNIAAVKLSACEITEDKQGAFCLSSFKASSIKITPSEAVSHLVPLVLPLRFTRGPSLGTLLPFYADIEMRCLSP